MKAALGKVMDTMQMVGNVNPAAKKVSRKYQFVKDSFTSIILLVIGIVFVFLVWFIGLILIGLSFIIFLVSLRHKKRFDRILKMRQELKDSPSLNEKASYVFTDLDSGKGKNRQGFVDEKENAMILTEKRIIFMHIPRLKFSDITNGDVLNSIGQAIDYDGVKKKVEEEMTSKGIRNMIKEYTAYAMNYNDISRIKINLFFSTATFIYRGRKFRYAIRRNQMEQFRQVFANYIKN